MPGPRWLARFNKRGTNRVFGPIAPWLPLFGVVEHVGRKSGRTYRTPINVFPRPGGCTIALTYGPKSEWVQNVLVAGGCRIETRGRSFQMTEPRIVHDPARRGVPALVRLPLWLVDASDFLVLGFLRERVPE